jgi:hypothetical protein
MPALYFLLALAFKSLTDTNRAGAPRPTTSVPAPTPESIRAGRRRVIVLLALGFFAFLLSQWLVKYSNYDCPAFLYA